MYRSLRFFGRHTIELLAALNATVLLVVGTYMAWVFNPSWLNRAGALITIVGILLAVSRFHRWAQQKAVALFESSFDLVTKDGRAVDKDGVRPLTQKERETIKPFAVANFHKELAEMVETDKGRIRTLEVVIVVGGTFLNGFGDYIISLLKGT